MICRGMYIQQLYVGYDEYLKYSLKKRVSISDYCNFNLYLNKEHFKSTLKVSVVTRVWCVLRLWVKEKAFRC